MNGDIKDVAVKPELTGESAIVRDTSEYAMLLDSAMFNQAWRAATMFSKSKLVPATFQGSPESCFVAMHMAVRLNLDPMAVMQKTYIVHGRPGMEAQLVIALVNSRGPFKGPIQWEQSGEGNQRQWTAYATHRETGERCAATVTWQMVTDEGWNKDKQLRDGGGVQKSKWNTIPELMGRYRSAVFLARLYCPEVIMGLSTVDELQDMDVVELETIPAVVETKVPQVEVIKEKLKRTRKPSSAPPPEVPAEENNAASGPSWLPRAISEEAIKDIVSLAVDKDYPVEMLLSDYEVPKLSELTEESGANILTFLAGLPDAG
jgi:hypothetical protein